MSSIRQRWQSTRLGRAGARTRALVIVAAGILVVGALGVGTAGASTRHHWWGHHWGPSQGSQPPAGASASPTASATASAAASASVPASQQPTGGAKPSASKSSAPAAGGSGSGTGNSGGGGAVTPPPVNAPVDYQLGGPYTPPAGVTVVSRDHTVSPAAGIYNICYINAFQTQTEDQSWWKSNHDDLLLKNGGRYVEDSNWNELILDISTAAKRTGLMSVVSPWIDQCASKGFKAVESDNLDTWTRSEGLLNKDNAIAMAKLITDYAHGKGLASGQKNAMELGATGRSQIGFDFVVAESCAQYNECGSYTSVYGSNIIAIEYGESNFEKACSQIGSKVSVVLRDVNVTAPGSSSYVFKTC